MSRNYLDEVELAVFKKLLIDKLGQYNHENNEIVFNCFSDIANYLEKGVDLPLLLINRFENNVLFEIHEEPKPGVLELVKFRADEFLASDYAIGYRELFYDQNGNHIRHDDLFDIALSSREYNNVGWLLTMKIKIENISSIKEKTKKILDEYISAYEIGDLSGNNIFTTEQHKHFILKLFYSLKNLDQRNLFIDSEMLSKNLPDIYSSNSKAKGQLRLLEHLLLFEKKGYIEIKDIDLSTIDSVFPAEITIAIKTPVNEIAKKEGIDFEGFKQEESKSAILKVEVTNQLDVKGLEEKVILQKPKKEIVLQKFPQNLKWSEIVLTFFNEQEVQVKARDKILTTSFEEMGFKNERKNAPDVQWHFLIQLARHDGEINWSNNKDLPQKDIDTLKKRKQILSEKLKQYFQMEEDPFYDYEEVKGYKLKINLAYST